jgi:glycerol-3-phosphate dehydrogenase
VERNLKSLVDNSYELLIVGGGVYGAVLCWLSASAGLNVALIEQKDFGHATSANSQKIIHGGLRYLQNMDFFRVVQSLKERNRLMLLAPHLVQPLRCTMPIYGHGLKGKETVIAGLSLYNLIARCVHNLSKNSAHLPEAGIINIDETTKLHPGIDRRNLKGAAFWYEGICQNTERLVLSFIKSAHRMGAVAANYTEAKRYKQYQNGCVVVLAKDNLSGQDIEIRADRVVNCTGPWFNNTMEILTNTTEETPQKFAVGLNLVTKPVFSKETAISLPNADRQDSRLFFFVPWRGKSIIGTEWFYCNHSIDKFEIKKEQCSSFIKKINAAYPPANLTLNDITFVHGGVVPCALPNGSGGEIPNIAKRFRILDLSKFGKRRIINVLGVKYTTAVDVAGKVLKFVFPSMKFDDSCQSRLIGGEFDDFGSLRKDLMHGWEEKLGEKKVDRLSINYGSEFDSLMAYTRKAGKQSSRAKIPHVEVLKAETLFAIKQEMAQKLSDVVLRRTEMGSANIPSTSVLNTVSTLMGKELGWSAAQMGEEIEELKRAYALLQ